MACPISIAYLSWTYGVLLIPTPKDLRARETYLVGSTVCINGRNCGRIMKLAWSGFSRMTRGLAPFTNDLY
jgi:hypothetical protein